jgi:LCP family protein required for cell wall assembly
MTAFLVAVAGTLIALAFFVLAGHSTQVAASFIHAQPGAVHWNENDRLTILLIGRASDGNDSPAASLALATYDPQTRSARVLSIPTNLWASIPGYGPGRLGDALSDGGIRVTVLTVESVLRLPIPYYAEAGPRTMAQLVDAFGGVTVHSPAPLQLGGDRFAAGPVHLNGARALAYSAASGSDPQSTLATMQRQISVLLALKRQSFTPQAFFRIPNLINTLGGSVTTNFPYDQIVDVARDIGALPNSRLQTTALSYLNNTVTGYDAQSTQVQLPDLQRIGSLAQHWIPTSYIRGLGSVTVVNGTGTPGQAASLGAWLGGENVRIGRLLTGPPAGYATTRVQYSRNAGPHVRALALSVATLLQIPASAVATPVGGSGVVVLMGRDYQDPTQQ